MAVANSTPSTPATRSLTAGLNPKAPKPPWLSTRSAWKPRSTTAEIERWAEVANTLMKPTRATAIRRAEAVAAVRFGDRAPFSRARVPVMPFSRGRKAPIARDSGPAANGASTMTPTTGP